MPVGFQFPAMTITSANQPLPAVISGMNLTVEPMVTNAPPKPINIPPQTTARYWRSVTLNPLVSITLGFSPKQRISNPYWVRYRKNQTAGTINSAAYVSSFWEKRISPTWGIDDK